MRKPLSVILTVVSIILLTACSAQPVSQLTSSEEKQVEVYSEPEVDNIMAGIKNDDYSMFSKDFDTTMQVAMGIASFTDLLQKLNAKIGACPSRSITQMTNKNGMIVVDYDLTCEKEQFVKLEVTFHPEAPHQVAGVGFLSPSLQ